MADDPTSWGERRHEIGWQPADANRDANKLFNNTWAAVPDAAPPILAVTATRKGLTPSQEKAFISIGRRLLCDSFIFHHGAAVGGDCDLARLTSVLRQLGKTIRIVAWPSNLASQCSAPALACSDETKPASPPLERNVRMIAGAEMVLAFPAGFEEEVRSGTWATIRAAERAGIQIVVVWPDGSIQWNNSWGGNCLHKCAGDTHFFTSKDLAADTSANEISTPFLPTE